jgi:hypothetical protein
VTSIAADVSNGLDKSTLLVSLTKGFVAISGIRLRPIVGTNPPPVTSNEGEG